MERSSGWSEQLGKMKVYIIINFVKTVKETVRKLRINELIKLLLTQLEDCVNRIQCEMYSNNLKLIYNILLKRHHK